MPSETVTVDRERWERVRDDAIKWAAWVLERGWGETFSDVGDRSPVEVEPDLSPEDREQLAQDLKIGWSDLNMSKRRPFWARQADYIAERWHITRRAT